MLLASLALAAFAQPSPSEGWQQLGEVPEAVILWDAAGARRDGDRVSVRIRVAVHAGGGGYSISRIEMICSASTARVVETENFTADHGRGPVDRGTLPFAPIQPDSLYERLKALVCPTQA